VLALVFERGLELFIRDPLLLEKQLTYASGHRLLCRTCKRV
jgi:hypothetical protein